MTSHTSYNEAVLLFQMKQYGKVLVILERLYKQIEPIEEALATRICFLLLDVYFEMGMPEKAGPVVMHLEKVLAPTGRQYRCNLFEMVSKQDVSFDGR